MFARGAVSGVFAFFGFVANGDVRSALRFDIVAALLDNNAPTGSKLDDNAGCSARLAANVDLVSFLACVNFNGFNFSLFTRLG